MTKPKSEVVHDFNELVNMTADELEAWLKTDDSGSAGWHNPSSSVGPGKGGEAVGHESGRHIVRILRSNPSRDADKYDEDEDVPHMAKVVAYCKRHLAQEEKANEGKDDEELQQTKSYKSLKNWGHDALKKRHGTESKSTTPAKRKADSKSQPEADEDAPEEGGEEDAEGEDESADEAQEEEAQEDDAGEADEDDDEEAQAVSAEGDDDDDEAEDQQDDDDDDEPKTKRAKRS